MDLSETSLRRLGVASETIRTAFTPILETEMERLLNLLDNCPPHLEELLSLRADIRSLRRLMKSLDSQIRRGSPRE